MVLDCFFALSFKAKTVKNGKLVRATLTKPERKQRQNIVTGNQGSCCYNEVTFIVPNIPIVLLCFVVFVELVPWSVMFKMHSLPLEKLYLQINSAQCKSCSIFFSFGVCIGYDIRTLFGGSLSFENFLSIDFRVWNMLNERQPLLIPIPFSACASWARCHGNTIKSWEVHAVNCASLCYYYNRPFAIVDHVINFCKHGKFC